MGGQHSLDLTSEVTHLVCAELFTPKYNYVAKMRLDVKIVDIKFVAAMYQQWMNGEDINPAEFEVAHRFPTLYGLKISVTGIPDGLYPENLFSCMLELIM
jgi:DNA replication regulator DPB11